MRYLLLCGLTAYLACSDIESAEQGRLVETSPEANSAELYLDTTFTIIFTEPFISSSLRAQSEDGPCSSEYSVLLSTDDFENCLGAEINETPDSSQRAVILTPSENLPPQSDIQLKLTNEISFQKHANLSETVLRYQTGTTAKPQEG